MSTTQRRWYCRECKREWIHPQECYANSAAVSITGNPINGKNCPVCGSPEIELIEFKPYFDGLDIPRDGTFKQIPIETIEVIPGITTSQNFTIRSEIPTALAVESEVKIEPTVQEIISEMNLTTELVQLATEVIAPIVEQIENSIYDLSDMD